MRDKWLHAISLAALTMICCAFFFGLLQCPVDDEENQQCVQVCNNKQVISSCAGGLSAL